MRAAAAEQLRALARICRRLGGQLMIVSRRDFYTLVDANDDIQLPFSAGSKYEYASHWRKKIIYAMRDTRHIGFIIHEAGHVFADRYPPDDDKCAEWEWLGWEISVARRIGAWSAWSRQNGNYRLGEGIDSGIGKDKDWSDLSTKERSAVSADRLSHAMKIGLLGKRGAPRSVR